MAAVGFVFRFLDVDAAHKITAINKILRQMMTDKTARPRYQYFCRFRHSIRVSTKWYKLTNLTSFDNFKAYLILQIRLLPLQTACC